MFRRLKARFGKKPVRRSPAELMLRLERADVYYLHIAKSGSTFLKNLFYYLDHGQQHIAGNRIHGEPELLRARAEDEARIRASKHAFAVIRDPLERFLSVYFDKIYGEGPLNFPDLREYFTETVGLDLSYDLDVEGHRRNCYLLIDWIAENLAGNTDQPVNFHWRRQARRLKRVESLDLELLTLDGLDWQLPMLLEEVLPDIREAMAAVQARNESVAPVNRADVVDAALRAKIEAVYTGDKRLYDRARARWADAGAGDRLRALAARDLPFYCVTTPKVGCTWLKNLFYILEYGEPFEAPLQIHGSGKVGHIVLERDSAPDAVKFFVVRDPVERFFSLYYEKVLSDGPQAFSWVTRRLAAKRAFDVNADTLGKHRTNCMALLGYLEHRFKVQPVAELNPHWRPQVETAKRVAGFGFVPVLLEELQPRLLQMAGARVGGLAAALALVPEKNASVREFPSAKILTADMAKRLSALYGADEALYEQVKRGRAENGVPPELQDYHGKT